MKDIKESGTQRWYNLVFEEEGTEDKSSRNQHRNIFKMSRVQLEPPDKRSAKKRNSSTKVKGNDRPNSPAAREDSNQNLDTKQEFSDSESRDDHK